MPRKEHHVIPNSEGGWGIKKNNGKRSIKNYSTQADAISHARNISRNQKSELIIHAKNGKIRNSDSHGNDPFPPKDKR